MFWTRLFADPTALALQRQALAEGLLVDGVCVEGGQQALGVWLEAQAQHRFNDEAARSRQQGFRSAPLANPWVQRSHYSSDAKGWFSPEALEVLSAMVEKGADVTAPLPSTGITSVELACRLIEPDALAILLRSPSAPPPPFFELPLLPVSPDSPQSILEWAVKSHAPQYLECLQAHGVALNHRNAQGQSWLFHAVSAPTIQRLVGTGLATDAVDQTGTSALASWVRLCVRPVTPAPAGLENNLEWALLQLLRGAPSYLTSAQDRSRATEEVLRDVRKALSSHSRLLPEIRIPDGKNWRTAWPVAVFFAKEALASTHRVQSMRPLLEVGAEQGWLEKADQQTVRGLPDGGWVALACWRALEHSPYTTKEKVLLKAARALKRSPRWWLDEEVLEQAWVVSVRLSNRTPYKEGLLLAWSGWLGQVHSLEDNAVPWDRVQQVLAWVAKMDPSKATRPAGDFLKRWLDEGRASDEERMAWVAVAMSVADQPGGISLLNASWPDGWQWPVSQPLSSSEQALLESVAKKTPSRASSVATSLSASRQLSLEDGLAPVRSQSRSARL